MDDIVIREGYSAMDWPAVTAMLTTAYWSEGIEQQEVCKGARHSALVVGAFDGERQVGYLRVISDKTRFAYILDVFVQADYRGCGVAVQLMDFALSHPDFTDVRLWLLITRNAHALYEKCGFVPLTRAGDWLEIRKDEKPR